MISLYITDDDIQYVIGSSASGSLKIDRYGQLQLEAGVVENGKIINDAAFKDRLMQLEQVASINAKVDIILDSQAVLQKLVKVPLLPHGKLKRVIRQEMYEFIDTHKEYVYDYAVVDGLIDGENQGSILCSAVEVDMLNQIAGIFKECKLGINSIDIDQSAVINFVRNMKIFSNMTCIIGVLDGTFFKASLFVNGKYVYANRFLLEQRNNLGVIAELSRIISSFNQFNRSQKNGAEVSAIYLCGMTDIEKPYCSNITTNVGIQTEVISAGMGIKSRGGRVFELSEYLYAAGNLFRK